MFNTFAEKKTLREILYSKFVRLWPALFVSVVFCFVLYLLKISTFHITANILMLLFIGRGLFEVPTTEIGVAWYTSSLFCSFVILYLIYKMFTDKSKYIFAFVSVLFYSSLFIKGNPYSEPLVFNNLINFFLMRGLAGLSTGYVLYYFLNTQKYIIKNKITATIFEILLSIFFVCITLFKDIQYSYPIIIISFLFLFSLMVKKDGYFFKILNKPFFSFLAKYSYTIFIIQENIFRYFINKLWYADCYIGGGKFFRMGSSPNVCLYYCRRFYLPHIGETASKIVEKTFTIK